MSEAPNSAITVSELNKYIKSKFDSDANLNGVWIKGEISNFTNHYKTGHFYMSLKDESSIIKAVMFSSSASKLDFTPESGMKVLCFGRVAVFERDGQYQLYITQMIPDGVGSLYIAYEQLKNKLEKEGLFSPTHKRKIPTIPLKVGVITSPTGAAVRDIINVITRRFPLASIILYPVLVQGEGAAPSLIEAVDYFNQTKSVDVIIIGRGGGSIEDLWAFNSEELARKIFDATIPIISAVGHETDFTICDFVADLRAPTPSAAAELAVPDSLELMAKFENLNHKVLILIANLVKSKKQQLFNLTNRRVFLQPEMMYQDKKMEVAYMSSKIESAITILLNKHKSVFGELLAKLNALNPLSILERGYSYATKDNVLIKSVNNLTIGDSISIDLVDGKVNTVVNNITKR